MSRRTGVLRGCKYYLVNVSEDNALQFNFLPRVVSNYARRINDAGSRLSDTKTDISRMGIFHENRKEYQSDPLGSMTKFRLLGPLH